MLFNSYPFLVFLPVVWTLYWSVFQKNIRTQNILLLAASYVFYGWWSWKFLLLLALSTLLDYFYGFMVASKSGRSSKIFMWLSVANNLGILAVFKYFNFFSTEFARLLTAIGLRADPFIIDVALPVGISFYTFHGMSYIFDVYNQRIKPIRNLVDYAVFVSFFPLLVAGPIERANHLLPQIQSERILRAERMVSGCKLIVWGLFKKVVIADNLGPYADHAFSNYASLPWETLLTGAVAFSFQIYGDFSGYSDIALGTARLFGFELLSNFRFPYFSRDIAEFWRRWHVSLSSWFRDYLYIPLGGSRTGRFTSVRNTMLIFLVSGFWHGAGWNYITWGFLHGLFFMPLLLSGRNRQNTGQIVAHDRGLPTARETFLMIRTFLLVTLAWVFFRSTDMGEALGYLAHFAKDAINSPMPSFKLHHGVVGGMVSISLLCDWWLRRDEREVKSPPGIRILIYAVATSLVMLFFGKEQSFIYFQF